MQIAMIPNTRDVVDKWPLWPIAGAAQRKQQEGEKDILKYKKANTQFNVVPPIKQTVCAFIGEVDENFIKLWGV